jgi:NADH-quinone oxidoreductase subunit E
MIDHHKKILSEKVRLQIDEWLKRYPPEQKRSGVIEALRFAQEENGGYLTQDIMDAVSDYLQLPKIAVYEVATFYTMFNLKPVGRHVVNVCTNLSCMLNGSEKILDHLKKRLEIDVNQTTPDGKITLREVECLAACICAPVMQVNKTYHEHLTVEKIDALLDELE